MIKGINPFNSSAKIDTAIKEKEKINTSEKTDSKNNKYDRIEINKLIEDNEKRINDFKESIRKMITKQGETTNLTLFGKNLTVSVEDSQKAAQSIEIGRASGGGSVW